MTTVSVDLQRRTLPNGREYCAELARTERQKDDCTGDLEDGFFASNRDKDRARNNLLRGVERIKLARSPCRALDFRCKREARKLDDGE